jgi:hypothetical protein
MPVHVQILRLLAATALFGMILLAFAGAHQLLEMACLVRLNARGCLLSCRDVLCNAILQFTHAR